MKRNQQTYITPEVTVLHLENQDVLTTSGIYESGGLRFTSQGDGDRTTWVAE